MECDLWLESVETEIWKSGWTKNIYFLFTTARSHFLFIVVYPDTNIIDFFFLRNMMSCEGPMCTSVEVDLVISHFLTPVMSVLLVS